MGTKISLNYCVDEASGMTANLTEECLAPEGFPVTLELTGVAEATFQVTERQPDHRGNLTWLGDKAGVVTGRIRQSMQPRPADETSQTKKVPAVKSRSEAGRTIKLLTCWPRCPRMDA